VAGIVVALLLTTPAARAQQDARVEQLGLAVEVGYGGGAPTGDWIPVEVRLAPRRPVLATLDVWTRSADGEQLRQRDIELRAGATAAYRFVMPTGAVRVAVREAGAEDVTVRAPAPATLDDTALIGLLDSPVEPPPVTDPVVERTARWASVDPAWLALGPTALQPLSGLVIDDATLTELDDRARRAVATAVTDGMDLVVTATNPGTVDLGGLVDAGGIRVTAPGAGSDLPSVEADGPAWAVSAADVWPDGDPRTTVAVSLQKGRGRVNVATIAPGPGPIAGASRLWSLLALGRPLRNEGLESFDTGAMLSQVLTTGADAVPALPWLAAFLVAYIVVVGPVSGAILARRRRRELTWVTVPTVTVVFTLAAVLAVPGARPLQQQRASLRWWLDGAGEQILLAGVRAPTEGVQNVRLPGEDWTVRTVASGPDGARVHTSGGDTAVALLLPSLAFGGVIAHRPLSAPPPLEVTTAADGDAVMVDVRNTDTRAFTRVEVRMGAARRTVGPLAPGATASVTFTPDALPDVAPHASVATLPGAAPTADRLLASGVLAPEPGIAWAVATRSGEAGEDTTTVAVGQRPTASGDATLSPLTIARTLVSGDARVGDFTLDGSEGVLRFRLPAEMAVDSVADRLGTDVPLEVWDWSTETWVTRADIFDDELGASDRLLSPTGELHVRNTTIDGPFDFAGRSVTAPPRERGSASEPAGGDPGDRANASEPAGGDPGDRANASEPAGGDPAERGS
jgi:hypothetical protein